MSEKVVATIYNRHYVNEDSFVFTCNYPTIGDYDEENSTFTDNSGKVFYAITNPNLMKTEIPVGFFNVIPISTIAQNIGENLTIEQAINNYETATRKIFYYVGKIKEGETFCIPLDTARITKETKEQYDLREKGIDPDEEFKKVEDGLSEEEKKDIDNHYEYGEMHPQLMALIMNIMNGEYSKEELQELKKQLKADFDDLAEVLTTIEFQEVADEAGDEVIKLPASSKIENVGTKKEGTRKVETVHDNYHEEEVKKNRIDIDELFNNVTKTLIAQDEPAKRVIAEIARKEMDYRKKRRGILLTGQTGVGKTELMRLIAKYINRPFLEIDATQLTVPGWVGKDIEEYLWKIYVDSGRNIEKAENAIVYIDEVDKKGSTRRDDHSKKGVLDVFLKFLDGTNYDACEDTKNSKEKVVINSSKMIKIFGGAFTDVYNNLEERQVGFTPSKKISEKEAKTKDFIEKGCMTNEFMGRVDVVKLNDLDVESIKRILLQSDQSALKIQEEIFKKLGVKITFSDSYISKVAKQAYDKKTGARGLDTVVDSTTWQAFARAYSKDDVEEIIIDDTTLDDASSYQLVKKKNNSASIE